MNSTSSPPDASGTPTIEALSELLDRVVALDALSARWAKVVTLLLEFVTTRRPSPGSWALQTGQPYDEAAEAAQAISTAIAAAAAEELFNDAALGFATAPAREALRSTVLAQVETLGGLIPDDLAVAVVAHAAAEALDGLFSESFVDAWRAAGELLVKPGTVFPRPERDLRNWTGGQSLNTRPSSLQSRSHDRTTSLAIAGPQFAEYSVVLDFEHWTAMAPATQGPLVVATVHPSVSLTDFDIENIDEHRPLYINHGPKRAPETRRLARDLIKQAAASGATVIVLPEYALTDEEHQELVVELDHQLTSPLVLVSGMSSRGEDGEVCNEADLCIFAPEGPLARFREPHRKLFGAPALGRDEKITAGTQVRVLVTSTCSVAVLICRDAMIDGLSRLVGDLGVHLYLVPVMTSKTATMVSMFDGLAGLSQTFTILANGPLVWDADGAEEAIRETSNRSEAAFVAPLAANAVVNCPPPRAPSVTAESVVPHSVGASLDSVPGFWLHLYATGASTWHGTP